MRLWRVGLLDAVSAAVCCALLCFHGSQNVSLACNTMFFAAFDDTAYHPARCCAVVWLGFRLLLFPVLRSTIDDVRICM